MNLIFSPPLGSGRLSLLSPRRSNPESLWCKVFQKRKAQTWEDGSASECRWLLCCSVPRLLSGQERQQKCFYPAERSNGYIAIIFQTSLPQIHKGYGCKIAITLFFIVNCWPMVISFIEFRQNAFIILPYTHEDHVLAAHVKCPFTIS